MTIHTCATFWEAMRAIVPNLPADDVTKCVITVDPLKSVDPVVELTMLARDQAGGLKLDGIYKDRRIATETKRFKIVPDEDVPT